MTGTPMLMLATEAILMSNKLLRPPRPTHTRICSGILVLLFSATASVANASIVTNTGGSLRQAIINANLTAGPDVITFNIPGTGLHTIAPLTAMPLITSPVTIDGYSQPGASPNTLSMGGNAVLRIELSGTNLPVVNGLRITAGSSTVRGLVINGFKGGSIRIDTNGSNIIQANFIRTNATGTAALPNGLNQNAIYVGSSSNLIGGTTPPHATSFLVMARESISRSATIACLRIRTSWGELSRDRRDRHKSRYAMGLGFRSSHRHPL